MNPHNVVLASGNAGKVRELNTLLSGYGIEVFHAQQVRRRNP